MKGPAEISVFADLSELTDGDTVVFEEYLSLNGKEWKLFNSTEISDKQKAPIFRFPATFIPKGYSLKIIQTKGSSKKIRVLPFRR